jgi:serine phosphatase RsbU (regulator of sigma subunit)
LLLADVAGHGISVTSTAADLRTLMRRFVNRLDQTEFVRLLNQQFTSLSKDGAFATAVVATFFEPSRRMTVCNAGHPRPLLYRAARQQWDFLGHTATKAFAGPSNLPLGLLEISAYDQFDVELEPGDRMLSYTDALMESNDATGEMLGEQGVLHILRLLGDVEPEKLIESLLEEIRARYPQNLTDDDVTVLLVQVNQRKASYTLGEKLRALSRFSGTLLRALNPKAERPPFPDLNLANLGGAIIPALARRWRAKPDPPDAKKGS